jgi:hypothetical protein
VTITGVSEHYTLLNQQETVTVQVTSGGVPVTTGQVTLTDAGQTKTVSVDANGTATVTFTFSLFHEQPQQHPIDASYSDGDTFAGGSTTTQSPNTVKDAILQTLFDIEILMLLFARGR